MVIKENNKEITIISEGTLIEGNVNVSGNMRVDGEVKGSLKIKGNLTVGKNGVIQADVEANNCSLGGKITGNMRIYEKTELLEKAELKGDVTTKEIIINEKAIFNGYCKMSDDKGTKEKVI